MADVLPPDAYVVIDAVATLPPESIQRMRSAIRGLHTRRRPASKKARGSATAMSHLERVVRERLSHRYAELREIDAGLVVMIADATTIAALAILDAHKLTEEEFEALVGPFRAEGVPVPSHAELLARR
jgi:hypothetical protein